jgi:hypothetical protein
MYVQDSIQMTAYHLALVRGSEPEHLQRFMLGKLSDLAWYHVARARPRQELADGAHQPGEGLLREAPALFVVGEELVGLFAEGLQSHHKLCSCNHRITAQFHWDCASVTL